MEINYESKEVFTAGSEIKFENSVIRSNLWDYCDPSVHVQATKTVPNKATAGAAVKNTDKKVIFENCISAIWKL